MTVLERMMRMGEGRQLRRLAKTAHLTNQLEAVYSEMSDDELKGLTAEFRARRADGESLSSLMPEAFAAVREASVRTLGLRHFDVQIMGGAALHEGSIAEMKTGEGKTLVATLPSYLRAIEGKGVHVVTVNDYLARYQSELMGRIFRFLGLETGCILGGMPAAERKAQYDADVTYGTNNEFGFDYLRDNMALRPEERVQRGHFFAIVDEVDSILIDEARTPLLISGPASVQNTRWYSDFAAIARSLIKDLDYEVDEKKRAVGVLEPGIDKVESSLGIANLYDTENTPLIGFLNNAIRAKELFRRDRDYVVSEGDLDIVDEHTGRILKGRRYSEGLHQALEAKEGLPIKAESQTFASITLQNYFRLYETLAGMTGTAQTEAAEFHSTYGMSVLPIPTHRSMIRVDQSDLLYKNERAKYNAIVEDIVARHAAGQPVLVGTTSVEKSEQLSHELRRVGIPHNVLNAKQHEQEATVIADAGRKGAVTVATNMAGRGTDIMLGGNPEFRAVQEMAHRGVDPAAEPERYEKEWPGVLEAARHAVEKEHNQVVEAGGLYVLGTERHESRRIDNQLRGRSGRQGDPGESRFYLSLEDDLMRIFQSPMVAGLLNSDRFPEDVPIESKVLSRGVRSAQAQLEGRNHELRKNVLKYDDVMNGQRKVIYAERARVLEGEDFSEDIQRFIDDVVRETIRASTSAGTPDDWDLEGIIRDLRMVFPASLTAEDILEEVGSKGRINPDFLIREFQSDAHLRYTEVEARIGVEIMRQVERQIILQVIDAKWREHLYEMDYLREGIGLRAMGQRDPLIEYQREGHQMFEGVAFGIKEQCLQVLFRVEKRVATGPEGATGGEAPPAGASITAGSAAATAVAAGAALAGAGSSRKRVVSNETTTGSGSSFSATPTLSYSGPTLDTASGKTESPKTKTKTKASADGASFPGTPRNAQCPCGSGKKYKLCHGEGAA